MNDHIAASIWVKKCIQFKKTLNDFLKITLQFVEASDHALVPHFLLDLLFQFKAREKLLEPLAAKQSNVKK